MEIRQERDVMDNDDFRTLGRMESDIRHHDQAIADINQRLSTFATKDDIRDIIRNELVDIRADITGIKSTLGDHSQRFEKIDGELTMLKVSTQSHDVRLGAIEQKIETLNQADAEIKVSIASLPTKTEFSTALTENRKWFVGTILTILFGCGSIALAILALNP